MTRKAQLVKDREAIITILEQPHIPTKKKLKTFDQISLQGGEGLWDGLMTLLTDDTVEPVIVSGKTHYRLA